jgi:hypothetical protein
MEQGRLIADGSPEALGGAPEGFTLAGRLGAALGAEEARRLAAEPVEESLDGD